MAVQLTHEIKHMEKVVCVCVIGVVLAAMLPLGAANDHLGFLIISSTCIATLVHALPTSVPH